MFRCFFNLFHDFNSDKDRTELLSTPDTHSVLPIDLARNRVALATVHVLETTTAALSSNAVAEVYIHSPSSEGTASPPQSPTESIELQSRKRGLDGEEKPAG